jgi:hypothetical protein
MRIPTIRGIIDRRILVNFRIDPDVLSNVCPAPFRPQIINGFGVAGICLIRLKQIRPRFVPSFLGISSENAAHRIAVEWDVNGHTQTGVFIPRRDTSSMLNALTGGRIFPGIHNRAHFEVRETINKYHIEMDSLDGSAHVAVDGQPTTELPTDSIFPTVAACSRFFEAGSLGYSPARLVNNYDGLELQSFNWHVEPLTVTHVKSSYFDDRQMFPADAVAFDNALLMRGIDHEWHSRDPLCCTSG